MAHRLFAPLPWLEVSGTRQNPVINAKDQPRSTRSCGDCTGCCTIVPVPQVQKAAHERCRFLAAVAPFEAAPRAGNCTIYADRPSSCRAWSCLWLVDMDLPDEARPDRCGVVFDMMADVIELRNDTTGEVIAHPVMQAWVDPARMRAYRDDVPRAVMALAMELFGLPTIVRFDERNAVTVVAPPPGETEWIEKEGICL